MSNYSGKFEFYSVRNFGQVLTDTFTFTRTHFKSLASFLFVIVAPVMLLSMVGMTYFFNKYFDVLLSLVKMPNAEKNGDNFVDNIIGTLPYLGFSLILTFILYSLVICTTLVYIKLYQSDSELTLKTIWKEIRKYLFKIILTQVFISLIFLVFGGLFVLPSLAGIAGIIISGFLLIFLLLASVFILIKFSYSYMFLVFENKSIIESLKESYFFCNGVFINTLGLMFVLSFVISLVSSVFQIPGFALVYANIIFMIIDENSPSMDLLNTAGSALLSLGSVLSYLVYAVLYIGLAINYFSTIEKREGRKSKEEIENIGKTDFE